MDNEVRKIKKGIEDEDIKTFWNNLQKGDVKKDLCYELNENIYAFYSYYGKDKMEYTLDDYVERVIQCIYLVLKTFARLRIYPDGFFDVIKKHKAEKICGEKGEVSLLYHDIRNEFARLRRHIKNNMDDIGKVYEDMVMFYRENGLKYNDASIIDDSHYMDNFCFKNCFITEDMIVSVSLDEDIVDLANLLFNYMSFLVEVGVNPKERLSEIIEEKKKSSTRK